MLAPLDLVRIALLRPELRNIAEAFIADVEAATGKKVSIPPRGGVRSAQDQVDLWNDRANNPYPVAQPGTSRHEYASALDINILGGTANDYALAAEIAELKYFLVPGLYFSTPDRVHFELRETLAQAQAAFAQMQQKRSYYVIGGILLAGFLILTMSDDA